MMHSYGIETRVQYVTMQFSLHFTSMKQLVMKYDDFLFRNEQPVVYTSPNSKVISNSSMGFPSKSKNLKTTRHVGCV